ncbi:MAG TPA: hypothetical protein VIL78_06125 [Hanamia sp.]
MELSKREKKLTREIIEAGLQKEFTKALLDADKILNDWKIKGLDNRNAYHNLYKHIIDFDKHIARRYDGMTGSRYLLVIIAQLQDGLISESDLENFSEEVKNIIKRSIE